MEADIGEKEPDASIFAEIREAEKRAEEILQNAEKEKEKIISDARRNASSLILKKFEEIDKERAKRIQNFQANVYVLKETKLGEIKDEIKKLEKSAPKKIEKTADIIFERFVEYMEVD